MLHCEITFHDFANRWALPFRIQGHHSSLLLVSYPYFNAKNTHSDSFKLSFSSFFTQQKTSTFWNIPLSDLCDQNWCCLVVYGSLKKRRGNFVSDNLKKNHRYSIRIDDFRTRVTEFNIFLWSSRILLI